jgi:hypothetical protein
LPFLPFLPPVDHEIMSHPRRALALFAATLTLAPLLRSPLARAQAAPAPPASAAPRPAASHTQASPAAPPPALQPTDSAVLAQAKELFRRGNTLLQSGEVELALDLFQQSRALVPGVGNTMNAAISLDRLGRFDEALRNYELVLKEFQDRLTDEDRKTIGVATTTLRRKVGSIDVAANVEGVLVIDGRRRGELPLSAPIRVLPGSHTVRVIRDGYAPAEAVVPVKVGEEASVDLRLEVLTSAGRLRVIDESGASDSEVVVDGAPVGKAPWEGTLGVGRHVVLLRGKDTGTGPSVASVVAGQTVPVSLRAAPLGPPLRLDPSPLTATVILDDVLLGAGPWEGRLPLGPHRVAASEEGYQTRSEALDGTTRGEVRLALEIDEDHPRWRRNQPSRLGVELFGGLGLGSGLGSDAESGCGSSCTGRSGPLGPLGGVRGSLELPNRLRFEIGVGYWRVTTSLDRTAPATRPTPGQALHSYDLHDELRLTGPFATLGVGYRLPLSRRFALIGRLGLGAYFAAASDTVTGQAVRGTDRADVFVDHSGRAVRSVDFFVQPEVGGQLSLGRVHVGAGVGLAVFLLDGPRSSLGDTQVQDAGTRCQGNPAQIACISADSGRAGEHPYGPFRLWIPQLSVGYTF